MDDFFSFSMLMLTHAFFSFISPIGGYKKVYHEGGKASIQILHNLAEKRLMAAPASEQLTMIKLLCARSKISSQFPIKKKRPLAA